MNTAERFGLARAGGVTEADPGDPGERRRVPLEVLLLATAVAFAVVGPLTHLVWCAAAMSGLATVVTLRRLRAEVRELRAES
jgi:hypothetical protein